MSRIDEWLTEKELNMSVYLVWKDAYSHSNWKDEKEESRVGGRCRNRLMGMKKYTTCMKDDLAKFVKITNAFILWPSNHDSRYLFSVHYFTHAKWRMYKIIYYNTVITKNILKIQMVVNRGLVKQVMVQLCNSLSETLEFDVVCISVFLEN